MVIALPLNVDRDVVLGSFLMHGTLTYFILDGVLGRDKLLQSAVLRISHMPK